LETGKVQELEVIRGSKGGVSGEAKPESVVAQGGAASDPAPKSAAAAVALKFM
jgi:hypothetical protein